MRNRSTFALFIVPMLVSLILAAGCNIFEFTSDSDKSSVQKAEDAIREGNYAKAQKELAPAVKDSLDSMSLYLNSKATLLDSGLDLALLIDIIESQDDLENGDNLNILATVDALSDAEKTNWYRTNMAIRANLAKIYKGKTVGIMQKDDISLGYTVSNLMSGVLGLRDTNRDGYIRSDDFQIDLTFIENIGSSNTDGFNFNGAKIKDDQGNVIQDTTFDGLTVFLGDWQQKIAVAGKIAAENQYEPDDINPLLAYVLSILKDGSDGIIDLLVNKDSTAFDTEKIEEQIKYAAAIANFYWYDDGIDNDGDGRVDEETIDGEDNDGDGLIDEDSDRHPSDPTGQENTQYIHIWQNWNN